MSHVDNSVTNQVADEVLMPVATENDESADVEKAHKYSTGSYFARYGTVMLVRSDEKLTKKQIYEEVLAGLRAESRVVEIGSSDCHPDWMGAFRAYMQRGKFPDELLLSSEFYFDAVKLVDPVYFTVSVPIKNQKPFRGEEDIPTSEYFAAWDGITLVVAWERDREVLIPPHSGGHVVIEIIGQALASRKLGLYVQACSQNCTNMFTHKDLRVEKFPGKGGLSCKKGRQNGRLIDVHVESEGGGGQVALEILLGMQWYGSQFARFKNYSRRIQDLEQYAREMVDELLQLNYSGISSDAGKRISWKSVKTLGIIPFRRRRALAAKTKTLVSSLWLALSRIEAIRRDWDRVQLHLLEKEDRYGIFFDADTGMDLKITSSMDTNFIRSAVEQHETRKDARITAVATFTGAVGGLVGAVIGGLLS